MISHQKTVYHLQSARVRKHGAVYTHVEITIIDPATVRAVFGYQRTVKPVWGREATETIIDDNTELEITGDNIPHDLLDHNGEFRPFRLDIFARQLARRFASQKD